MQIDSKDEIRKAGLPSPDIADAVALTFAEVFPTWDVHRLAGSQRSQYAEEIPDLLEDW